MRPGRFRVLPPHTRLPLPRRLLGATVAAAALAAVVTATWAAARPADSDRVWEWKGRDSAGVPAALNLHRLSPTSATVRVVYSFAGLCSSETVANLFAVRVRADGRFSFHGLVERDGVLAVDLEGRFEGKKVSGTARARVSALAACESGQRTSGEATFAATCNPCGDPSPAAAPTGVKVLSPPPGPLLRPRRHANGPIAFSRAGPRTGELLTVSASGGNIRHVTRGRADYAPAFSPDGRRIAFNRREGARAAIYVVNRDGSGLRRVPTPGAKALDPAWSPDGRRLAFVVLGGYKGNTLYVANLDGSGLTQLTGAVPGAANPAWSPDGSAIAFGALVGETHDIWIVRGRGARRLVKNGSFPAWSPDAKQLAYVSQQTTRSGPYAALNVIRSDGSGRRLIHRTGPGDGIGRPSWSPDGRLIAFNRGFLPDPYQELAIVGADGSSLRRLTRNALDDNGATWGRR